MGEIANTAASDIPAGTWVDRLAPQALRPYLRLARVDRPIGTWLLLIPCWWSVALATPSWPDPWLLALFAVGALVMRGAGCTVNDIVDRDFDARVARTATRPIASGAVSVPQAFGFLGLQLLVGFAVLAQFNTVTMIAGLSSVVLIPIYPFMKRFTYWPQIFLGIVFNWGAFLGWTAVRGDLGAPALILYAACVFWTLGYDTIYAHQDKADDARIGLKSTALRLAGNTRPWLFGFYGATVTLLAGAGYHAGLGWPFYAVLAAAAAQLGWQALRVDIDDPRDCLAKFKSNRQFGWMVFTAIVAGRVVV